MGFSYCAPTKSLTPKTSGKRHTDTTNEETTKKIRAIQERQSEWEKDFLSAQKNAATDQHLEAAKLYNQLGEPDKAREEMSHWREEQTKHQEQQTNHHDKQA